MKHFSCLSLATYSLALCSLNAFATNSGKEAQLLSGLNHAELLQQKTVTLTGVVKDHLGVPIEGVQVISDGADKKFCLTNEKGEYQLRVSSNAKHLTFNYLGYDKQHVKINGRHTINVVMQEQDNVLDQVVVTGYTTQTRSRMTTSIAKLDSKVLASAPRSNVGSALQGAIPGLKVVQTTGQPGSTPSMVLRGGTDFNGNGSPLILVDGVPSSFYGLNSDDIASIEVLKDAASTAIYGARAANGVILVTTKRGEAGKSRITFRAKTTWNSRPHDPMKYLGAKDYVKFNRLALGSAREVMGNRFPFSAFITGAHGAGTGNNTTNSVYTTMYLTDQNRYLLENGEGWMTIADPLDPNKTLIFQDNDYSDLFYQNSHSQDYTVSFEGGNNKATYYLGLGMLDDKGLVMGSKFKRYSMTFNGSYKINDRIKVSSNMMYVHSNNTPPYNSLYWLFQRCAGMAPTSRIYYTNPDGSNSNEYHPGGFRSFGNPLYYHDKFPRKNLEQRLSLGAQVDFKLLEPLTLSIKGSHFAINNTDESFSKAYKEGNNMVTERASAFKYNRYLTNQFTALLQYKDKIREDHHLAAMLGWEWYQNKGFDAWAATRNSPTDLIPTMNAGAEAKNKPTSGRTEYAIASVLGQANYDYDMRYLAGFTFRYDGTSRLGDNKWGFFPGVSLGWNAHNEEFFKNSRVSKVITTLKPRISYGVNGNINPLGNYTVQGTYGTTSVYDSETGYVNTQLPNPTLMWERSKTFNVGLDFGLWNGRVNLMADYFVRNIEDKLAAKKLPKWTGFSSITTNNGTIQNRGIELQLSARVLEAKDFVWNASMNLTHVISYAKKLPFNGIEKNRQGGRLIYAHAGSNETIYVGGNQEGERLGYDLVTGYVFDGVYQTQEQLDEHKDRVVEFAYNKKKRYLGDAIWRDINGDGVINSLDRVVIGRSTPKLTGGFSTDLNYKGWSLYVKTDFAVGHYLINGRRVKGLAQTQGNQNGPLEIRDSWTPDNPHSNIPRFCFTDQQKNHQAAGGDQGGYSSSSSRLLEKGNYLALREVTLSYTWDKPFLNEYVKGAKLYLTGSNLHYFTDYSGSTPEENPGGADTGRYPLPKTVTFGINLIF